MKDRLAVSWSKNKRGKSLTSWAQQLWSSQISSTIIQRWQMQVMSPLQQLRHPMLCKYPITSAKSLRKWYWQEAQHPLLQSSPQIGTLRQVPCFVIASVKMLKKADQQSYFRLKTVITLLFTDRVGIDLASVRSKALLPQSRNLHPTLKTSKQSWLPKSKSTSKIRRATVAYWISHSSLPFKVLKHPKSESTQMTKTKKINKKTKMSNWKTSTKD